MVKFNARKLAAVALSQSTETVRYYFNGVYFSGNKAVATDGHKLTVATDDIDNGEGVILPISKKAITAMKKKNADTVEIKNDLIHVFDSEGTLLHIEPCKIIDDTFPEWQRVVPADANTTCAGAFGEPVMRTICDTAKILGSNGFKITGSDELSAHRVQYVGHPDIFSIVMPIRT